jgi:aryl-alcohol dehydrogenase-like predicted oxidoreductase
LATILEVHLRAGNLKILVKMPSVVTESRLRDAHAQLKKRGINLASNQIHYSLAYRLPEMNGVKRACEELGVSIIAYSPLGQGERCA